MEGLSVERLSRDGELRKFWHSYDLLYYVKRECTGIVSEIYGGPDAFRNLVLTGGIVVFLVSDSIGKIVGGMSYRNESDDNICIDLLGIKQEYQAKGMGSFLLRSFLEDTKHAQQRLVKLFCREDSIAFEFYKKHGFKIIWNKRSGTFVRMELFRPVKKS